MLSTVYLDTFAYKKGKIFFNRILIKYYKILTNLIFFAPNSSNVAWLKIGEKYKNLQKINVKLWGNTMRRIFYREWQNERIDTIICRNGTV